MTSATLPAPRDRDGHLRPVPWRGMAWVVWRQHRLAILGIAVLFGVATTYLLATGLLIHHAYAAVAACRPAGSPVCARTAGSFLDAVAPAVGATLALLQVLPALIGAFAGAPVLARELETGTFRYAWTQGFGRARWTVAKLVPLAILLSASAGAFSLLVSWYVQPVWAAGDQNGPLYPTVFDLRGLALAGWTLFAFAIGALAGILLRRVVPAMFATLAAWAGLAFLAGAYLRQHYLAPLTTTDPDRRGQAWVISQNWMHDGHRVSLDMINRALHVIDVRAVTTGLFEPGPATPTGLDPVRYLMRHGYTLLTTYQPASRFWTFQWIEAAWLLTLSILLLLATVWLVRRRAA